MLCDFQTRIYPSKVLSKGKEENHAKFKDKLYHFVDSSQMKH